MPRAAATSPRRSVRARQQPSIAPSQTNSVSSNSSNRAERNTRHSNKPASPQKSSTPQSLSSEEVGGPARASNSEPPQPRRSKRQHDIDEEDVTKTEEAVEDEIIEDEETTRCMCGQLEYPGPPVDAPAGSARGGKNASPPDELSDEISGLFIQCDDCLVWQHGGCVSIMEQSAVPDNYYCEECKPDLHQIFKSTSGQKYSRYLPVWEKTHPKSHRKMSIARETIETKPPGKEKEKDKERAPRTNASASAEPFGKRRSTMNSRAAYDEDEVLRKVLEESKAEGTSVTDGGASRKGKRTRDDSEDMRSDVKRRRTLSSPGSLSRSEAGSSDEEGQDATSSKGAKKTPRGAAARSQKEKEQREQREKERLEAANKRKGRADRRRAEDAAESEQPEESVIKISSSNAKSSPINENAPETPSAPAPMPSKRGGKRPGAGRGRGNHHAAADHDSRPSPMDTDMAEAGPSFHAPTTNGTGKRGGRKAAQHHSTDQTTDSDKDISLANGTNSTSTDTDINGNARAPTSDPSNNHTPLTTSKGKEPSMLELKRRAIAMLDYIERAQMDIARKVQKEAGDAAVKLGLSPAASPSALAVAISSNGPVSREVEPGVRDILHVEGLKEKLVGWQAEYGGGTAAAATAQ